MPELSNYTDNLPEAFAKKIIHKLRNEGYGGPDPNELATRLIYELNTKGFEVTPTPDSDKKLTLRITWNGVYIGQMHEKRWNEKDPCACLYRFKVDGKRTFVNDAPKDFDVEAFALEHGCDRNQLDLKSEKNLKDPKKTKSYLWVKDAETSLCLMQDSARRINELFSPRGSQEPECIEADLRAIEQDPSLTQAQRRAYRDARLGQGKFRKDLEDEFGYACSVTRLAAREVLRASHIVPWSKSSRPQQIDAKNGLLLSANIDALFDRYMITFRPDGKLEVSKLITQPDLEKLGPIQDLQSKPCAERAEYLMKHNAEFDRRVQIQLNCVKDSAR